MEGHDPSAVAAGGDGSTAAPAVAAPLLPPRAPPRRLSSTPLGSYVSEPPSTLAMMRTYAQDLLSHQGEEVQQQAVPAGEIPAAWRGSGAPASGGAIELPPVSLVGKGPLERPTHFQLGPTISTPRRRTAPAEAGCPGGDASSPAYAKLRSSIGAHRQARQQVDCRIAMHADGWTGGGPLHTRRCPLAASRKRSAAWAAMQGG